MHLHLGTAANSTGLLLNWLVGLTVRACFLLATFETDADHDDCH